MGASNLTGALADFSNSGEHLSLVAPGDHSGGCSGVLVAIPAGDAAARPVLLSDLGGDGGARYAYLPGTSFSAPEVSGVAALIWAARPELKNYEVADIIKQSAARAATAGWTPTMGCGQLDAAAALELATGRSSAGSGLRRSRRQAPGLARTRHVANRDRARRLRKPRRNGQPPLQGRRR